MSASLDPALDQLVVANRILAHEDVVDGFGHISIRHPERPDRYFLSRSRSPQLVTRADLVEFHLDNRPVEAQQQRLYAERPIHGSLYVARPDVMSVCHNHAHSVIPYGVTDTFIRPILHMGAVIGEQVPIWDIRHEFGDTHLLVVTNEQGDSLARTVGANRCALMRGHGAVTVGRTVQETVFTAIYLMVNAKLLFDAKQIGGQINYLTPGEVKIAAETLLSPLSQERAWEYWSARAGFPPGAKVV
ncbi:MAG: class II aldolase/adducin family protein [Alphaproteobacteria bacterium]